MPKRTPRQTSFKTFEGSSVKIPVWLFIVAGVYGDSVGP